MIVTPPIVAVADSIHVRLLHNNERKCKNGKIRKSGPFRAYLHREVLIYRVACKTRGRALWGHATAFGHKKGAFFAPADAIFDTFSLSHGQNSLFIYCNSLLCVIFRFLVKTIRTGDVFQTDGMRVHQTGHCRFSLARTSCMKAWNSFHVEMELTFTRKGLG